MLYTAGVDAVFTGHVHVRPVWLFALRLQVTFFTPRHPTPPLASLSPLSRQAYERNHRAYNNQRDPNGPVYITIGDGGNREGLATTWLKQTPVSAYRMATYVRSTLLPPSPKPPTHTGAPLSRPPLPHSSAPRPLTCAGPRRADHCECLACILGVALQPRC